MQREVVMTGIGGQGIQLASKIMALAAIAEDRQAMLLGRYDGAMRGGQTDASVVLADRDLRALPILETAWAAMVMHGDFWASSREMIRPGGVIMLNSALLDDADRDDCTVLSVDANQVAVDVGAKLGAGLVLLAAFCAATDLVGIESLVTAMRQVVPPYRTQHLATNEAALRAGFDAVPHGQVPAWPAAPVDGAA